MTQACRSTQPLARIGERDINVVAACEGPSLHFLIVGKRQRENHEHDGETYPVKETACYLRFPIVVQAGLHIRLLVLHPNRR